MLPRNNKLGRILGLIFFFTAIIFMYFHFSGKELDSTEVVNIDLTNVETEKEEKNSLHLFFPTLDNSTNIPTNILDLTTQVGTIEEIGENSLDKHILVYPSWLKNKSWGLVKDSSRDFELTPTDIIGGAIDKEEEISWTHFFKGTSNGLMLELGAMNGHDFSVSRFYEKRAGWKSILIEASPDALQIPRTRPNALSLRIAVCETDTTVHFVHAGGGVGGILEFMTPQFLNAFHFNLLKHNLTKSETNVLDMFDWKKVDAAKNVEKQLCVPLKIVFDRFQITHINFLVLDLEGGELLALKSLDFDRIHFDVMCVETNRFDNKSDPYIDEVLNFLVSKNYKVFDRINGRNSWFVSPNWKKP